MDFNLFLVFIFVFVIFGGGGVLFWRMRPSSRKEPNDNLPRDATLTPWVSERCRTLSGTCGKGRIEHTRRCVQEGRNGGKMCDDFTQSKTEDCYVNCKRPSIIDWGHPNDADGIPIGSPLKGWYDLSGQGQPNDYCRWVGDKSDMFFACHNEKDAYVKANPSHITFSGGPANKLAPYVPSIVHKMCPANDKYTLTNDSDLKKSIANGFFSHCGASCVYDYRNPTKSGWYWNGSNWVKVDDMEKHPCGTRHYAEMKRAVNKYENAFDVKNAWSE